MREASAVALDSRTGRSSTGALTLRTIMRPPAGAAPGLADAGPVAPVEPAAAAGVPAVPVVGPAAAEAALGLAAAAGPETSAGLEAPGLVAPAGLAAAGLAAPAGLAGLTGLSAESAASSALGPLSAGPPRDRDANGMPSCGAGSSAGTVSVQVATPMAR